MTADSTAPAFFEVRDRPWWWEWSPRVEEPVEALPKRVDVAVVGSGYAGLAAALKGNYILDTQSTTSYCGARAETENGASQ